MRHRRPWTVLLDTVVLLIVVVLFPLCPLTPYHPYHPPHIGDKILVRYQPALTSDELEQQLTLVEKEREEMRYYLRIHNVTDEGYNDVARYNEQLQQEYRLLTRRTEHAHTVSRDTIPAKHRPLIAVKIWGGHWKAGHFTRSALYGPGITRDSLGRIVSAVWRADTVVSAIRQDSIGIYHGQMDRHLQASGFGVMDHRDGCHQEGFWKEDRLNGFAFDSSPLHQLRTGEWKAGRFLGERLRYTNERIYGIDISRHQHEKGRKTFSINWNKLRITSLGKRHATEGRTFPVSFVYIKATEGTTVRNRYYKIDYLQALRAKVHVGAYHFFSLTSTATAQADFFLRHAGIRRADFPPVLDVEPSDRQIAQIGGSDVLMRRIRTFLSIVEERTGKRPILYVSQMFINRHMQNAQDIKQRYNIWIARYSQYKPDVKLVYWQLCPDGRVDGITGDVDINVFNGYQSQFDDFVNTGFYK